MNKIEAELAVKRSQSFVNKRYTRDGKYYIVSMVNANIENGTKDKYEVIVSLKENTPHTQIAIPLSFFLDNYDEA